MPLVGSNQKGVADISVCTIFTSAHDLVQVAFFIWTDVSSPKRKENKSVVYTLPFSLLTRLYAGTSGSKD